MGIFRKILICVVFSVLGFTCVAFAAQVDFEIYNIEYDGKNCLISARQFEEAPKNIEVSVFDSDGAPFLEYKVKSDSSGYFEAVFEAEPSEYEISFVSGEKKIVIDIDLSGTKELFGNSMKKINIEKISYHADGISIFGKLNSDENQVALRMRDMSVSGLESVVVMYQTKVNDGLFELKFKVKAGTYSLEICTEKEDRIRCSLGIADIVKNMTQRDEFEYLTDKFEAYVDELELLKNECENKFIATDYENAYISIIKKFIANMKNEAEHDDYSRIGQYNYALTKLYSKCYADMNAYLDGGKQPFSVPSYVTGDILLEGSTVLAPVMENGEVVYKPYFFTGFGNWESVAEETEFISQIGMNAIATQVNMYELFVEDNVSGWGVGFRGEPDANFTVRAENGTNHILNVDYSECDGYKYIYQILKVKPNTKYKYGLKAKGNVSYEGVLHINVNGLEGVGRKKIKSSSEWVNYDYEFITGEEQTEVTFVILAEGVIDGVMIDDVYFKEADCEENLISNGGFEEFEERNLLDVEAEKFGVCINRYTINILKDRLKEAEENNVMADILVGVSGMPYYLINFDPNMVVNGNSFTPFAFDNKNFREIVSLYARVVIDAVKDCKAVKSICLLNEPAAFSNEDSHYLPLWYGYLENKYMDIDELNATYGMNYEDFDDVQMPISNSSHSYVEATPLYYDYRCFNDFVLCSFYEWFCNELKNDKSDLLLHIKIMDYFRYDYGRYLNEGTNWEKLSQMVDLNGCDAHSYYQNKNTPLTMKMAWYDFMTSVKDAPIWDTESHIILDSRNITYSYNMSSYIGAEVWNSAVHGRGAGIYWIWDTDDLSMPWGSRYNQNSNFAMRPYEIAKMSESALDINRLSSEINALNKQNSKVGLLYSRTSAGYNSDYMNVLGTAYEEIIFNGQKVDFITETDLEKIQDYKLVVVPEATNVNKSTIEELSEYVKNGGELLLMGENSLEFDEYNRPHSKEIVDYIYSVADTENSCSEKIQSMELSEIVLIDNKTCEIPDGIEWTYTEYNGKMLINILNYSYDKEKNIEVYYKGKKITELCELRKGDKSGTFVAKPYEPMLLAFDILSFDLIDDKGNIIEEDISEIKSGVVKCNSTLNEGNLILALYKDDVLVDVITNDDIMEIKLEESGKYRLMATVWGFEDIKPLCESRNLVTEVVE